ncbi:MAG TPA: pyrroloquinoline quinone-dependent dehydrogenase [Gemmatimonadales bacterium]|nr:pyrroloquinoline quinone-dependent dehydrogenase [Gemmatimonadales bacterium]
MNPALLLALAALQTPGDWPAYGRDAGGSRFSPLAEITRSNVKDLRVAWVYRTGDLMRDRSRFEATPLVVAGTMYVSTPLGRVIALDPAHGVERWRYDAHVSLEGGYGDFANRGVATWLDVTRSVGAPCRRRIFVATVDARLIALDAATGTPCADFGAAGTVDLSHDLLNAPEYAGEYEVTSPPTIVADLVIVGSSVADNHRTNAPNGVVRAYDARTGKQRWSWDPIPRAPGMPGAANAWSVFSADPARDLVFVPTGSASPDFYGGARLGDNRWANSVVALRASTGQFVWGFQVVHHDLWDYDVPAQPVLFNLHRDGRQIPAVAVSTKMGHLFILDRLTGKPLFPVEERPVPTSDVPGEEAWPTQPFPSELFRLAPEGIRPTDAFGVTPDMKEQCRALIASLRSEGIFTPPTVRGMIIFPGNIGGSNWSAVAVDEARGLIVAPTNRLATVITLVPRDQLHAAHMAHPGIEVGQMIGTPYGMLRDWLRSSDGRLCNPPPWGTLTAVDVNAPSRRWEVPLGRMPQFAGVTGSERWGSVNLGGAMVTAGGLVFIAATLDHHLRAFSEETGEELWSAALPAGGHALPMTYTADGRQYVAIVAGGHDRLPSGQGDFVLAFTLPGVGAPSPDTTTGQAEGAYTAELRIGGAKITGSLVVRPAGDSLIGALTTDSLAVSGPVVVRRAPSGLLLRFSFRYPKKGCDGTIMGLGDYADGGRLVEGPFELSGQCVGDEGGRGAFSLWRR